MKKYNEIDLNISLIYIVLMIIYILPTRMLININFRVDQIIFTLISLLYIVNYWIKVKRIDLRDIIIILIMFYFIFMTKSISYIHLITVLTVDKMANNKEKIKFKINNSKFIYIALFFVIFYSLIYFGYRGRYLYTGLREINQCGFAALLLFILIYKRSKIIGGILLVVGLLTLSKNYLLGMSIFFISEYLYNKGLIKNNKYIYKICDFKLLSIISIIALLVLSSCFTKLYKDNKLETYGSGINRFFVIADYSNYYRFTTNTNLFEIYKLYPRKIITGIQGDEFIELSKEVAFLKQRLYRPIKPHNYFFAYMSTFGIFSIIIFIYISKIFNKVVDKRNIGILLVIFSYITFLGIGSTSYWLYLSIFTLIAYREKSII